MHRENGAGRPTFLATGGCWPKLKIPGTDCERGEGGKKDVVSRRSLLIFLDFHGVQARVCVIREM